MEYKTRFVFFIYAEAGVKNNLKFGPRPSKKRKTKSASNKKLMTLTPQVEQKQTILKKLKTSQRR